MGEGGSGRWQQIDKHHAYITYALVCARRAEKRIMICLLNMTMLIGIPRTEEEAVKLEKVYDAYQHLANEIESNMKRVHNKIYDWRND